MVVEEYVKPLYTPIPMGTWFEMYVVRKITKSGIFLRREVKLFIGKVG